MENTHTCTHCKKEYNALLPKGYCTGCLNYLMHDKGYKSDFDQFIDNGSATIEINAFIIINPKTGKHENHRQPPELYWQMVDSESKNAKCVPCKVTYKI